MRALLSLAGALVLARADVNPRGVCDTSGSNQTAFDFSFKNVYGNETIKMDQFRGKVTLVVNVATYWGLTGQYHGLNALQSEHGTDGFQVLGVPCNLFGKVRWSLFISLKQQ